MAGPAPADISYSKAQALEDNMISVHVVGPTNKPRYESELLDFIGLVTRSLWIAVSGKSSKERTDLR
jgi:hypothetical protein